MLFPQGGSFIHPDQKAEKFVIFLHGYGADGANLIDIGHLWRKDLPPTLFWSPNGLERCDEYSQGFQWFPLYDRTLERIAPQLHKAVETVAQTIKEEIHSLQLTPQDVMLVGFSQGAMLALELLWHIEGIGGVIAYSGRSYDRSRPSPTLHKTPVLLVHGTEDTVVPFDHLEGAKTCLTRHGFFVQTCVCHGTGHSIDEKGLEVGRLFVKNTFMIE